ncbi:MAG: hypothetical protein ACOCVF_01615 [bacterium]
MALISTVERNKLFLQVKHELGHPIRKIQLTDEMMDSFLEMSIEDYSSYVNEWLIEQQWISLYGLDINESEFVTAFSTKTNDFMRSFTFAYSKQVGLGTNAPSENESWILKRDYITTSAHTQVYRIPSGREVNEVLWETPPEIDQGLIDPFAISNWTAGNFGWSYLGRPAQYVQPTYSLLLAAQDRRTKQRVLQSTLTYRITGGPQGTKMLHLYPIPGGRSEIRGRWGKHYAGRKVWYFYYDVNENGRKKCLEENDDTVLLPSDAPIDILKWEKLNSVAKQQIRDLLIARSKIVLGGVRGYFSGEVGATEKQLTMDYRHLLDEGETLKEQTKEKIFATLEKLSLRQMTEDRAAIAENVNKERGYQPPRTPIIVI